MFQTLYVEPVLIVKQKQFCGYGITPTSNVCSLSHVSLYNIICEIDIGLGLGHGVKQLWQKPPPTGAEPGGQPLVQ